MRICISKILKKSGHDDIAYTSSIQKFENGVNEVFSLLGTNFPMDSFQDITQNIKRATAQYVTNSNIYRLSSTNLIQFLTYRAS